MALSKRLLKRRSKHTWIRRSIRVTVEIVDLSDIMQAPLPCDAWSDIHPLTSRRVP